MRTWCNWMVNTGGARPYQSVVVLAAVPAAVVSGLWGPQAALVVAGLDGVGEAAFVVAGFDGVGEAAFVVAGFGRGTAAALVVAGFVYRQRRGRGRRRCRPVRTRSRGRRRIRAAGRRRNGGRSTGGRAVRKENAGVAGGPG